MSASSPSGDDARSAKAAGLSWHPVAVYRSFTLRPRLLVAVAAAAVAYLFSPSGSPAGVNPSIAWIAGGLVYIFLALHTMATLDVAGLRQRAAREDEGRAAILAIVLIAIAASFAAIVALQGNLKGGSHPRAWLMLLAAVTLVTSWMVTQIVFTLHYAHDYYRPDDDGDGSDAAQGLHFVDTKAPDYWDFLYFATSIGATSQTSDVAIRSRTMRRLVTVHCIVSFLFNTSVLALSINLAASAVGN